MPLEASHARINPRTRTKLDFVLERSVDRCPMAAITKRRAIAEKLIASASGSTASLEQFRVVAQHALGKITATDVVRSASRS